MNRQKRPDLIKIRRQTVGIIRKPLRNLMMKIPLVIKRIEKCEDIQGVVDGENSGGKPRELSKNRDCQKSHKNKIDFSHDQLRYP